MIMILSLTPAYKSHQLFLQHGSPFHPFLTQFSSSSAISSSIIFVWLILTLAKLNTVSGERASTSISSVATFSEEDTFIINLLSQEQFSDCSVLTLQDRYENGDSVNRILHDVAVSQTQSTSSFSSTKPVFSIKYIFPEVTELEKIGSRLKNLGLKFALSGNDSKSLSLKLMSSLPLQFPITVSNYRKMGKQCSVVILMLNDLRSEFMHNIYKLITPVFLPITKKDEDFYIFKTIPKYHEKLLLMKELPNKIKFKIAVGSSTQGRRDVPVEVKVHTVCFFCEPGGTPRLLQLPVSHQNLPRADTIYFPDFVWDLNGKLLHVSLPYIRAKIEADPPWEGTSNARRGNWKMLFEKFLTVKFNFTYNMFTSTGHDGNKGGGGTGVQLLNGTWIGVTGDLISGRADLGIVIANTPKRIHYIDFTNSFYDIGCLTFVTAQPTRIYSPAALLWPFDLGMWTCIITSTIFSITFFFSIFKIMEIWNFGSGKKWPFSVQIQFLLSTFLEQDSPVFPESTPMRCFIALWLFFTMVLTNVYRCKLVTLLAFPVLGKLPKTFEDLAFSEYQVGFMKHGDSAYNTLAASTDPVYVRLVEEMEIFSGVGLKCLEKVVNTSKYGCIAYDFALVHLKERNLSDSETRKLVFAPARTYNIWLGLGTEGKSIYRLNFSKWLSYTRQFHLADIWDKMDMYYNVRLLKRKWWQNTGQMDKAKHVEQGLDNLTFKHIAGAFFVLIFALTLSTLVFLQEILSFYKKDIFKWVTSFFTLCTDTLKNYMIRGRPFTKIQIESLQP